MNVNEVLKEIEGHQFAARLNVASDIGTFCKAARREEVVRKLFRGLASSGVRWRVLLRTHELARQRIDLRYENPWDTAFAVYLWLMSVKDRQLAEMMAGAVSQAPQCWWAARMAREVLLEMWMRMRPPSFPRGHSGRG